MLCAITVWEQEVACVRICVQYVGSSSPPTPSAGFFYFYFF